METLAYFMAYITREYLDPIGVWLGLLLAGPIIWTWYDVVWGRRKREKAWFRQACQHTGRLPAVLILDLLPGKSARAQVAHFMAQHEALKAIPLEEREVVVEMDKTLVPTDAPELARKLRSAMNELAQKGVDELHVFIAAPMFASAMLGAELANAACKIHLYQIDQNDRAKYIDFGPLKHPAGF